MDQDEAEKKLLDWSKAGLIFSSWVIDYKYTNMYLHIIRTLPPRVPGRELMEHNEDKEVLPRQVINFMQSVDCILSQAYL